MPLRNTRTTIAIEFSHLFDILSYCNLLLTILGLSHLLYFANLPIHFYIDPFHSSFSISPTPPHLRFVKLFGHVLPSPSQLLRRLATLRARSPVLLLVRCSSCIHLSSENTSGLSARGVQSWKLDFLVFLTSRGVRTPLQPSLVQHTLG
jgi:hypothetical protein